MKASSVAVRAFILFLLACPALRAAPADAVPPPAETPCEVIVSGRTSTLKSIVIRKVGQNIPRVYHGRYTCGNTPGFDWYVSQHFALKANVGDALAEHFLTLAELAYPHYVEVFGREPEGIETTRLAMVHAMDLESLQAAVVSDIGQPWAGGGGSVTLPHDFCAYNFPSGSLRYHRNDINIHEGLHLFQIALQGGFETPNRFTEGITHCLANHVYDPDKKQLTVAVFDKAPINNPMDAGLRTFLEKGAPDIGEIISEQAPKELYPAAQALYTAFFWSDPQRLMQWRLWRDEMLAAEDAGKDPRKLDADIMRRICGGSFDKLNQQWQAWLRARHTTFTHVDWGWEQWGDTLQTYGWPWNAKFFSQMDINHAPGRRWPPDPWRMDYPRDPRPALVGPVALGTEEPSFGCVVDFAPAQGKGWAGIGLGVEGRYLMRAVVDQNRALVLDGTLLGLQSGLKETPFPPKLLEAAQKTNRVGLTLKIAKAGLEATVRAGDPPAMAETTVLYPLSPEERLDLLGRPMALICRDARHRITPFFEEPPAGPPDLSKPAPANPWRFAGDREAYGLYRAAWRLGDKAPASLLALRDAMLAAEDKDAGAQQQALQAYRQRVAGVAKEVAAAGSPDARLALADLSGVSLRLSPDPMATADRPRFLATVTGAPDARVTGTLAFAAAPAAGMGLAPAAETLAIAPGGQAQLAWEPQPAAGAGPISVAATAEVTWQGVTLQLAGGRAARPSIPCYWVIGPFDNKGDADVDTAQPVETEPFDPAKTYPGKGGRPAAWSKALRPAGAGLNDEFVVDFGKLYGGGGVSAYALVWVISPRDMPARLVAGSDDGLVAWVNDRRVHAALGRRAYQYRADKVPITLKAGANKVLLRVVQHSGEWLMSAGIESEDGEALPELRYSLEPPPAGSPGR